MQRIDWWPIGLLMFYDHQAERIERALLALDQEIEECNKNISAAIEILELLEQDPSPNYFDLFKDELSEEERQIVLIEKEGWQLENLLGIAFVLCQTYINYVISLVKRVHKACIQKEITLSTTDGSKDEVMRFSSAIVKGTKYSQIEVINACANYFKHSDEWPEEWRNVDNKSAKTVEIMKACGASYYDPHSNLSSVAVLLCKPSPYCMEMFADILKNWGLAVFENYASELEKKNPYRR